MNTLNKKNNDLINNFLESKANISDLTKATYTNDYKRLVNIVLGDNKKKSIITQTQANIIKSITTANIPTNTKINTLKLYRNLLIFKDTPHKKTDKELLKLFKLKDDEQAPKNKMIIEDSGLTYDILQDILNDADGLEYLILYLLINFNTRNMDLIINKTSNTALYKNLLKGNTNNNILYQKYGVYQYVRGDYKTLKFHGVLQNTITDEKFIKIADNLKDGLVFVNKKGVAYTTQNITKYINSIFSNYSDRLQGINQQIIYKVITQHYEGLNDNNKLREIAKNRGHTRTTQEAEYSTR